MLTFVTVLIFAGALGVANFAMYAAIAPALPKIGAALSGRGVAPSRPVMPPRRAATVYATITTQASPSQWRAAA